MSGNKDDTTHDIDLLTEDEARAICQRHGVDFHVDDEAEAFPRIRREVTASDDVPAVVAAVAAAIDEVFAAVTRPDLRWT